MKSRLALFFVFCVACFCPGSSVRAEDPTGPYVPVHGELYDAARAHLIKLGWKPISASCDTEHVCWGPNWPELVSDLKANTNCARFRKATKLLKACTYVEPDASFVDTVTIVDGH